MGQIEENKFVEYELWWDAVIMNTGRKMTKTFENDNEAFTNALILTGGTRGMMKWVYSHLKGRRRIAPIEELDTDSKKQIWAFIREICLNKTNDKNVMKDVAVAFYTLEYFLNEKDK